ncbi:polyprenyl synthetase family protein [Gracilibacillus timonensis]|uniref:polyprenyl synthetase family protein n=1 Tax=Gracilibacillus timonensis TaxID=1816696 RepID=UPI000825D9F9|nr:polyprenyl synthetase family protein [Gracilibacillus timonensis]
MSEHYYEMKLRQAEDYFQSLQAQATSSHFVDALIDDLQQYEKSKQNIWVNLDKSASQLGPSLLTQLARAGMLDHYLFRSVSYIYLRDLGRDVTTPVMQKRIAEITKSVKGYLKKKQQRLSFDLAELYRLAQQESLETVFFWVTDKLSNISTLMPEGMDPAEAKRKLIKIIAGVVIHEIEELKDETSLHIRQQRLDHAVRIGYYYGLTYPFIDDLLDAAILSPQEKQNFSFFIRQTLLTGEVVPLEAQDWQEQNRDLIQAVHDELAEAFTFLKNNQPVERVQDFLDNAYLFFQSQEIDRNKCLDDPSYTNHQLYVPVILKSASSRLIVRSFQSYSEDKQVEDNLFYYGIYNQLSDDLTDLQQDLALQSVTPYTYFLTYADEQAEIRNPFLMYWSVIYSFIHTVHQGKSEIRNLILDRVINGLQRLQDRLGKERYQAIMQQISFDARFDQVLNQVVQKTKNVAFFDKLMRDQLLDTLRKKKQAKEHFLSIMKDTKWQIDRYLRLDSPENDLEKAVNYSLEGNAKRVRPIMTWVMAKEGFGLSEAFILPLVKSVEYMHTASLIFDDLPSQDNAPTRRGRLTLHEKYNHALAELTALWMTQNAVEEQASMKEADPTLVLQLIAYSTRTTQRMCQGQLVDLEAKGKILQLAELKELSVYKTSLGFEAALMMPLIMADAPEEMKQAATQFAYHAGIVFQIKDDLLDVEGESTALGKQAGLDRLNQSATFVSILGIEAAKKEMWEHYQEAVLCLKQLPSLSFFQQLLDFILFRKH